MNNDRLISIKRNYRLAALQYLKTTPEYTAWADDYSKNLPTRHDYLLRRLAKRAELARAFDRAAAPVYHAYEVAAIARAQTRP